MCFRILPRPDHHVLLLPAIKGRRRLIRREATARLLTLSVGLGLGGCVQLGPDYQQPEVQVREEWALPEGAGLAASPDDMVTWWQSFGDSVLVDLPLTPSWVGASHATHWPTST